MADPSALPSAALARPRAGLLDAQSRMSPDQPPHSVLVQPRTELLIFLPPRAARS